jgi:hypothetical protein
MAQVPASVAASGESERATNRAISSMAARTTWANTSTRSGARPPWSAMAAAGCLSTTGGAASSCSWSRWRPGWPGLTLSCAALLWISTVSQATSYWVLAAQMVVFGIGMGLTQAPATEAIMGAVPAHKAGVGSAVNDATRLFGGTLGVAVIGSLTASLYTSRLAATLPAGLPARAISAARGSVGGAVIAARKTSQAGFPELGSRLKDAAILAFLHSFAGACLVAGAVAAAGALVAIFLLPARPADSRTEIRRPPAPILRTRAPPNARTSGPGERPPWCTA